LPNVKDNGSLVTVSLNKKKFLKMSFFASLFLGLIVAWLGFGERGFIHLYRMEKERQAHVERILKLEAENQKLLREIERIRTDEDYVEYVARRDLGLVKENEIIYRFVREEEEITAPENHANW
jgi:cell division protein FtsB